MPQQPSEAPSIDESLPGHASQRDVQRTALRELVGLLTESATTESEIEARHRQARDELEKATADAKEGLEQRLAALHEAADQKHAGWVRDVDDKFRADVEALDASNDATRGRINRDHENVLAGVKNRFEQSAFMADSLMEATQNSIRDEAKKAKEASDEQTAALDAMEAQGAELVQVYGQPLPEAEPRPASLEGDPADAFRDYRNDAERHLSNLKALQVPRLFVGWRPWAAAVGLLAVGGVVGQVVTMSPTLRVNAIFLGVLAALVVGVGLALLLKAVGGRQVSAEFERLVNAAATARDALDLRQAELHRRHAQLNADAQQTRDAEIRKAKGKFAPYLQRADETRDENLHNVQIEYMQKVHAIETARDRGRREADEWKRTTLHDLQRSQHDDLAAARSKLDAQGRDGTRWYEDSRSAVERRWYERVEQLRAPINRGSAGADGQPGGWDEAYWRGWSPAAPFGQVVRFGELHVDLKKVAAEHPQGASFNLELPAPFTVPAGLAVPKQASLLIQTDRAGRPEALGTLQTVMLRLLTTLPPGRVRFTILDPVGLGQNFAGFMHLADHDEALIGGRIWTDSEHIDARLRDLTEHMETVIQKYLRNEFQTIDDYNDQAGELAEPYRFLVISDFPVGFEGDAFRRLSSILQSGPRCGVYTLILRDARLHLPAGVHLDDLDHHGANLVRDTDSNRFVWEDDVFGRFPLTLDPPPSEALLTHLVHVVGKHAKDSKRVEVPFETIAPPDDKFWTGSSADDLRVPIGKTGATRLQQLRLGRGVAQHALIAGKTGSGKSTLLHAMITNLAMWYSPDEVEFYLIDFKKGVEFKTYAVHSLPHARAIAVESDREFGLSVLQRLDAELTRRGDLFRRAGVQDIGAYRKQGSAQGSGFRVQGSERGAGEGSGFRGQGSGAEAAGTSSLSPEPRTLNPPMPRTLLIIDEFQEFFSEDDKLAQESGLLLDRLVRQGRAFGIHLLLGSQTIGGTSGLARSTIGQMAVRIALQTSEADSHLILGDNNAAARLLSRPGEAIYNDQGGLVEGNSPFQVAWLSDDRKDAYLDRVRRRADARSPGAEGDSNGEPAVVFEGNAPADLRKNARLLQLLDARDWPAAASAPAAGWIGDPVAIKEATAVVFRKQSGANLLVIGQQEEAALATLVSCMISLAAQRGPSGAGGARFVVLDGTPADSPLAGVFAKVKAVLPHDTATPEFRAAGDAMNDLASEVQRRLDAPPAPPDVSAEAPDVYVVIYGLQRYRDLRKSEDDFSFSMSTSDEPKKPNPGKQFADVLKDGPAVGVHVLAWIDTATAIDRTLDRNSMREFDHRVLFQMSAADSSNLIDSPAANKLGFHRALSYSEEQGTMEKFRPYALPDKALLEHVWSKLGSRATVHVARP